ncbi:antibiotic biosynthesis monooxygenase [Streptomyces sp. cmx-4-9]|uniref:antibiotic biosynthesis monooxygenase n=1 Tax=Streptomyces sp. cmx-4-9 TaxID=2790941 RepID=UPI0039813E44
MKCTVQPVTRPHFGRDGVGMVEAGAWRLGTAQRQEAAVDALARTWAGRPWPAAELLSYTVLAGTDGDSLFHYAQWADEAAYEKFLRTGREDRDAEVDAAVPGIVREGLHRYLPDRTTGRATATPGCVVIVEAAFDPEAPHAARTFVDLVVDALATDPAPAAGGISANFHRDALGTRMLNYAEWTDAQAHAEALAAPGTGIGSDTEAWHRVLSFPALSHNSVRRYVPAFTLAPRI